MTDVVEITEVQLPEGPKLLVEWSSPWQEFVTAIRPAMGRSPDALAGEARVGLFPYRGMLLSWIVEALLLIAAVVLPGELARMHPYMPPPPPKYYIIYYSGDELPRTEDRGGAQAGRAGRPGGQEAHHRTQTIRVARGSTVREKVVDAPKLNLPHSNSAVANLLAFKKIPGPAPTEGLKSSRRAPTLPESVVSPAPEIRRDQMSSHATLNATVVPPTPNMPQRDLSALRIPGSHPVEVVPPPVSAPEQMATMNPRLTLPAPTVVAPPPQVTRDIASMGPGFGAGDLHKQVVPPPIQMGGSLSQRTAAGLGGGSVVPPPPSMTGGTSLSGRGQGNRGAGLGGVMDAGSMAAPPVSGGSGNGTGVVVSTQPGSSVAVPGSGGAGSLAMSPTGGDKPGIGGSGGGSGISRGSGAGSGFSGEGPGASKDSTGTGHGSDPNARGGISPYPGTGGAGSGANGTPALPGVSVRGGNSNIVTLPSFGSGADQPNSAGRSSAGDKNHSPGITVVATSRSGGAFNFYGTLKGDKVYTIYIGGAVMQFSDPTSAAHPYAEDLISPEPLRADLPANLPKARLVIACVLDRSGMIKNAKVLEPGPADMTAAVLAALSNWKFRPVMRGSQPVEVNAILGFNINTN